MDGKDGKDGMGVACSGSCNNLWVMGNKQQDEPKQKTPKGQEIPIPKRGEFLRNLRKVAKTDSVTKDRSKK